MRVDFADTSFWNYAEIGKSLGLPFDLIGRDHLAELDDRCCFRAMLGAMPDNCA